MKFDKFSNVPVKKVNINSTCKKYDALTEKLEKATSADEAKKVVYEKIRLDDKINSDIQIVQIRNTIDINDKEINKLMDYYDANLPKLSEVDNKFSKVLVKSPFRKELEEEFSSYYFLKVENNMKTFSPEIMDDLAEENAISSEYNRLMGKATTTFRGQELPITKLDPFMDSKDRLERKEASEAYWEFFAKNEEKLGDIYSRLVSVRDRMAKKLGFDNYLKLGYLRLGRSDYDEKDVAKYREKVISDIVPLTQKLYKKQAKRIGIKKMAYYDLRLQFLSGNPKPKGTPKELIEKAQKMYAEMNKIPSKYFNFMVEHEMMDVEAKPGKIPGGYMTYIPTLKSSFIFSNFNGSSGDVDVLTHEFGHSLQGFLASNIKVPELRSPGYECSEIHSMSMEFLTYPWMKLFFEEDDPKYRYSHVVDGLEFIPYGVCVDHFQDWVYKNPHASHEQRKAKWRELEKIYTPQKVFGKENQFLESGGYWMRQLHIYVDPLYYIDYTIAQVAAFEFFVESLRSPKKTFKKYINYCKLGGTLPYKQLLKESGIANPMDDQTIPNLIPKLNKYLKKFDDSKF